MRRLAQLSQAAKGQNASSLLLQRLSVLRMSLPNISAQSAALLRSSFLTDTSAAGATTEAAAVN